MHKQKHNFLIQIVKFPKYIFGILSVHMFKIRHKINVKYMNGHVIRTTSTELYSFTSFVIWLKPKYWEFEQLKLVKLCHIYPKRNQFLYICGIYQIKVNHYENLSQQRKVVQRSMMADRQWVWTTSAFSPEPYSVYTWTR